METQATFEEVSPVYKAFVDKFKPMKTTEVMEDHNMKTAIEMTIATSREEYHQAGELIRDACKEYVSNLKKYGLLKVGNFTEDGKTFSDKQFDDYYSAIVTLAKRFFPNACYAPCVFIAKHEDGRIVSALVVIPAPYPRAVCFSYISTLPYFRMKGIASNLHAFAEELYAKENVSILIGPQPDNAPAIACAHRGHEIAKQNGALFGGEIENGILRPLKLNH